MTPDPSRFPRKSFIAAALLLALAGCTPEQRGAEPATGTPAAPPATPAAAAIPASASGTAFCLGRYALHLPAGARVIGRDQTMVHLGLRSRDVATGTTLAHLPNHAPWLTAADLNTRIDQSVTPIGTDTVLLTWRMTGREAETVDTEAVRLFPGRLIAAHGRHEGSAGIAAQREAALALARAAAPLPAGALPPDGFCVDRFVIRRGFEWQESAGAGFTLGQTRQLFVTTRTNGPTPGDRLSAGGPGTMPPGVRVERAGVRAAGGHAGDELVLSRSRGRDMLLLWRFVGAPNSGAEPAIELRLEATNVTAPEALLAEWDAMLASLRRRGD